MARRRRWAWRRESDRTTGWSRRVAGIVLLVLGLVTAGGVFVFHAWTADLPPADSLLSRVSGDATKIYDRDGALLFEVLDPRAGRRTRVRLEDLPPHVTRAVIAVEDAGFYHHPGVDVRGVARAAWHLVRERRIVSGGSTITQQLARLVMLGDAERRERSVRRKTREIVLAVELTRRYDKDTILELYLNEVNFGQLAYGIEAAARTYFGKPARELDLAESALLAGLIQSPAAYNPRVDLDAARRRQRVVLDLMVKAGAVDRAEADLARREPVHHAAGDGPLHAPHFVTWVRNLLEARYGAEAVNGGGMYVVTSLDLDLQREAEAIVARRMADLARREPGKPDSHATDAALVAIDPDTGQVLAMVGSADYFDVSIDGAVNVALALRQPGSAMKPITYAAAFDAGRWGLRRASADDLPGRPVLPFTPATVLSDVPTSFVTREGEPYRPQNYDRMWHGPINLRRALATSSNLVAVKVLDAVGIDALIDTAEALGITTLADRDRYGLALTLGGGEVRLVELTAAYAGLGNGGRRVTPAPILAVMDADAFNAAAGDFSAWTGVSTVSDSPTVSPQAAFLVTDILADDTARLPAFGEGSVLALDRPAAAKTGTTTDFRDNWTVGYSPDLAVGVWVGNADNTPMAYISGITGAGPIWHDVMVAAHRSRPVRAFPRPDGLVRVATCAASGALPGESCRRRAVEWFIAGTEPRHVDASYRALAIDSATGLTWAEGCHGPRLERVYRILPPDASEWGRAAGIPVPPDETCDGRRVADAGERAPGGADRTLDDRQGSRGGGDGTVGGSDTSASPAAVKAPALVIARPAPNTTFALSAQVPSGVQRIDVAAQPGSQVRLQTVTLMVDEVPLATLTRPPYRVSWLLAAGRHAVRAVGTDAAGNEVASSTVHFRVLAEDPGSVE